MNDSADIYLNGKYTGNIPFYQAVDRLVVIEAQTAGHLLVICIGTIYKFYVEPTDSSKGLLAISGDQVAELNWNPC